MHLRMGEFLTQYRPCPDPGSSGMECDAQLARALFLHRLRRLEELTLW